MKKLTLILICFFVFLFAGCQNQPVDPSNNPTGIDTTGFQKEMNVQHPFRLSAVCKTELGYYFNYEGLLYFLDAATGNMAAVCAKPECSHKDNTCNAWVNAKMLSFYQGKLYYVNSDAKSDSIYTLYSVEPDGTNHTKIQQLQLEYVSWRTVLGYPILANGSLWFLEGDSKIYTLKLGEDVKKAVLVFGDDMSDTLESSWKFWADDSEVYAMNHILDNTGYAQDILYRLGATELETCEIWRSTEISKSVSDASWYITSGHLYYYFSGSDLWDIELGTGKAKKMIALADTVKSATALFTDSYFVLLDDQPDSRYGMQSGFREGGKNITVYDYSGNIMGEVSLSSIYEKYTDTVQCSPVFADGNCVYVLAYRGMYRSASTLFYQIAWDTGSIYEVTNWPGAGISYDATPQTEQIIG